MSVTKGYARRILQALAYFPVSFGVIGLLAYHIRVPEPFTGSYRFKDVFLFYGSPLNTEFWGIHVWTLALCASFLALLFVRGQSPREIVTMTQLRILLLVLLTIVTLLVDIFFNAMIGFTEFIYEIRRHLILPFFLYIDVHLFLLYLWTYLPFARDKARV